MPKRRYVFTSNMKVEFPFLKNSDEIKNVLYTLCKLISSIENGGCSDIK